MIFTLTCASSLAPEGLNKYMFSLSRRTILGISPIDQLLHDVRSRSHVASAEHKSVLLSVSIPLRSKIM